MLRNGLGRWGEGGTRKRMRVSWIHGIRTQSLIQGTNKCLNCHAVWQPLVCILRQNNEAVVFGRAGSIFAERKGLARAVQVYSFSNWKRINTKRSAKIQGDTESSEKLWRSYHETFFIKIPLETFLLPYKNSEGEGETGWMRDVVNIQSSGFDL